MPSVVIRGARLEYEVLGDQGTWITLSPGGRRDMSDVRSLAVQLQQRGYRVLIHDRRNCGKSDISIDVQQPEYEVWADDLLHLLDHLGIAKVVAGGGSSGCRLSLRFALKYPDRVLALFLYRVTGGQFAAKRLAKKYYEDLIVAARQGGMQAVCENEHFASLIEIRPENKDVLLAMNAEEFIAAMSNWQRQFIDGASGPVIGASLEQLQSIALPTLIIPGNDRTHNHAVAEVAHRAIAGSEFFDIYPGDQDRDIIPMHEWAPAEPQMADLFADFAERRLASSSIH